MITDKTVCKLLEFQIAQLRHAYMQLNSERVVNQKQFANGLISPIIRTLEGIQDGFKDRIQVT